MEKIWLQHYPSGVAAEIDETQYPSLVDVFDRGVSRYAARPAFTSMGTTITFAQLGAQATQFAAFLQQELKLEPGDRVALMMPNLLQYPIALFGTLAAACVVVNVNPLYTARELEHQLNDSGAQVIVIVENFAHVLAEVLPRTAVKHVVVTALGDRLGFPKSLIVNMVVRHVKKMVPSWHIPGVLSFNAALARGAASQFRKPKVGPEDIAFLQYTGGTTGVSKGAMLLHRNVVANLLQVRAWTNSRVREGEEVVITALPLYHIFALVMNCLAYVEAGGHNILIPNARDIPGFVKELARHRFTVITGVNTLFNALLNNPDFAKLDFSSLRLAAGGGTAVLKGTAEKWKTLTGSTLVEGYGLTEASPCVCINPVDINEYSGAVGMPLPSTEISIRDAEGIEVALGQPGELCLRGPQVMKGYWNRQDETDKVIDQDGFLHTGDVAVSDVRGVIRLVDRIKDMILVSGFNVYPTEIEDVVTQHPGVLEAAAIGVPDEHSGEAVRLFVIKKDPTLTEDVLIQFCRAKLTGYKVPKQIVFRSDLPKTNVGKILRRELRNLPG